MENNEKLLEAAMTIKENCEKTGVGSGNPCCFAINGVCEGTSYCALTPYDGAPMLWKVEREKKGRWKPADQALAYGLKANGYNSVTRSIVIGGAVALGRSKQALVLGDDMFAGVAAGEVVNLDEIIGEDEDGKDF